MPKVVWKITKIYADGHIWTETEDVAPTDTEKFFDDPGLVTVLITRNVRRDGGQGPSH